MPFDAYNGIDVVIVHIEIYTVLNDNIIITRVPNWFSYAWDGYDG